MPPDTGLLESAFRIRLYNTDSTTGSNKLHFVAVLSLPGLAWPYLANFDVSWRETRWIVVRSAIDET
jgi:hypothetical protein